MSATLGHPEWLTSPAVAAVLDALEAKGGAGCARFVGGCVRNGLLGAPVDDIDIATTLSPDQVTAALRAAGLRAIPTGVEHGTVTAISQGQPFEITTLRRDVETDGRRAVVAFTGDWAEDARRRDFTLNALYADRAGAVFDPVGSGVADAQAGRIVFVGDPATRIGEDYLRILRFFRFYAWYGRGPADPAALAACAALKGGMDKLAAERITKELLKLLAAPDPAPAVTLMSKTGVLAQILPGAKGLARLAALVSIQARNQLAADALLRLAALLPDGAEPAVPRLRLSNDQRDRLTAALTGGRPDPFGPEPKGRRAIHAMGGQAVADKAMLAWAGEGGTPGADWWFDLFHLAQSWTPPPLPVSGADALDAGAPKGPAVGAALREVEAWWAERGFVDDRAAAMEKLRSVVQGLAT